MEKNNHNQKDNDFVNIEIDEDYLNTQFKESYYENPKSDTNNEVFQSMIVIPKNNNSNSKYNKYNEIGILSKEDKNSNATAEKNLPFFLTNKTTYEIYTEKLNIIEDWVYYAEENLSTQRLVKVYSEHINNQEAYMFFQYKFKNFYYYKKSTICFKDLIFLFLKYDFYSDSDYQNNSPFIDFLVNVNEFKNLVLIPNDRIKRINIRNDLLYGNNKNYFNRDHYEDKLLDNYINKIVDYIKESGDKQFTFIDEVFETTEESFKHKEISNFTKYNIICLLGNMNKISQKLESHYLMLISKNNYGFKEEIKNLTKIKDLKTITINNNKYNFHATNKQNKKLNTSNTSNAYNTYNSHIADVNIYDDKLIKEFQSKFYYYFEMFLGKLASYYTYIEKIYLMLLILEKCFNIKLTENNNNNDNNLNMPDIKGIMKNKLSISISFKTLFKKSILNLSSMLLKSISVSFIESNLGIIISPLLLAFSLSSGFSYLQKSIINIESINSLGSYILKDLFSFFGNSLKVSGDTSNIIHFNNEICRLIQEQKDIYDSLFDLNSLLLYHSLEKRIEKKFDILISIENIKLKLKNSFQGIQMIEEYIEQNHKFVIEFD